MCLPVTKIVHLTHISRSCDFVSVKASLHSPPISPLNPSYESTRRHHPQLPSASSTITPTPPRVSSINYSFNNRQFRALHTRLPSCILLSPCDPRSRRLARPRIQSILWCQNLSCGPSMSLLPSLNSSLHAHAGSVSMCHADTPRRATPRCSYSCLVRRRSALIITLY